MSAARRLLSVPMLVLAYAAIVVLRVVVEWITDDEDWR